MRDLLSLQMWVQGSGFRVQGLGFRVCPQTSGDSSDSSEPANEAGRARRGLRFRVQGIGFRHA